MLIWTKFQHIHLAAYHSYITNTKINKVKQIFLCVIIPEQCKNNTSTLVKNWIVLKQTLKQLYTNTWIAWHKQEKIEKHSATNEASHNK